MKPVVRNCMTLDPPKPHPLRIWHKLGRIYRMYNLNNLNGSCESIGECQQAWGFCERIAVVRVFIQKSFFHHVEAAVWENFYAT